MGRGEPFRFPFVIPGLDGCGGMVDLEVVVKLFMVVLDRNCADESGGLVCVFARYLGRVRRCNIN